MKSPLVYFGGKSRVADVIWDRFGDVSNFIVNQARLWAAGGRTRQRERRDGTPYQRWADQGFIELSSGDVIDYRDIMARLEWASDMFDLEEICFDPWNSRQISVPRKATPASRYARASRR